MWCGVLLGLQNSTFSQLKQGENKQSVVHCKFLCAAVKNAPCTIMCVDKEVKKSRLKTNVALEKKKKNVPLKKLCS